MRSWRFRLQQTLCSVLGSACLVLSAAAAPVTAIGPADSQHAGEGLPAAQAPANRALPLSMRALDKSMTPEVRTGIGELDLLLQSAAQPNRPDAPSQRAAPLSAAAASAAAAELAALRIKAAQLATSPDTEMAAGEAGERKALLLQTLGTLQGDARVVAPVQRREWVSAPGGGGSGGGWQEPRRSAAAAPAVLVDDHPLRRLPREAVEFLRENGYWMLGLASVIAVLGVALKLYSRRI
jgi:hypothetical protein